MLMRVPRGIVAIAGLITGALLLAGCATPEHKPAAEPAEQPAGFAVPASLGTGWQTVLSWAEQQDNPKAVENANALGADHLIDAQNLSDAHGGRDALVVEYTQGDYAALATLRAVKAQSPGFFVHALTSDKEYLGTVLPQEEIRVFGDIQCDLIHVDPSEPGETDENTRSECMRSSPELTVWVQSETAVPETIADAVASAWEQLGGSDEVAVWPVPENADVAVDLPDTVGAFSAAEFVDRLAPSRQSIEEYAAADALALMSLYGGAAAASNRYADVEYRLAFTLSAVRADSPTPFVAHLDIERLGVIAPLNQTIAIGETTCLVRNGLVQDGGSVSDLEPEVQWCTRSGNGVTVFIDDIGGTSAGDPIEIGAVVDEVWSSLSQ